MQAERATRNGSPVLLLWICHATPTEEPYSKLDVDTYGWFLEQIEPLKQAALADLRAAADLAALEQARVSYLGSNGKFTALMKQLGTLPKEEKPAAGKAINAAKVELEAALAARRAELELKAAAAQGTRPISPCPAAAARWASCIRLTQVTEDIVRSFRKIGFVVADGPEVEDEYHCFDALNTPADHPARDTQDTFYSAGTPTPELRAAAPAAHAHLVGADPGDEEAAAAGAHHRAGPGLSAGQRRRHAQSHLPPGRRPLCGPQVTVGDLKGTVEFVFRELMGPETRIRFRPHYFSYTEPSFEIDFSSALTRKMGKEWLEIAGCGMVHPAGVRERRLRSRGLDRLGVRVRHRAHRHDPLRDQ